MATFYLLLSALKVGFQWILGRFKVGYYRKRRSPLGRFFWIFCELTPVCTLQCEISRNPVESSIHVASWSRWPGDQCGHPCHRARGHKPMSSVRNIGRIHHRPTQIFQFGKSGISSSSNPAPTSSFPMRWCTQPRSQSQCCLLMSWVTSNMYEYAMWMYRCVDCILRNTGSSIAPC